MDDYLANFERIFNRETLQTQLSFMAVFIGIYEHMRETLLARIEVLLCYENHRGKDGKIHYVHSDSYKKEIEERTLDDGQISKDRLRNTMLWLRNEGAISDKDYSEFRSLREKRNAYTHEMTDFIWQGVPKEDVTKMKELLDLYTKIDKWWFNEIEIPTSEELVADVYEKDSVESVAILTFKMVINSLYGGKSEEYIEMIKTIRKQKRET